MTLPSAISAFRHWLAILALVVASLGGQASAQTRFLKPEQAFRYDATITETLLTVTLHVHEGYYLYRSRLSFVTDSSGVVLGRADYPTGSTHHDDYFGDQEIYRGDPVFRIPVTLAADAPATIRLHVKLQGCADAGLCYPPQTFIQELTTPRTIAAPATPVATTSPKGRAPLDLDRRPQTQADAFLPPEQAFRIEASRPATDQLLVKINIAPGYYLYRSRFRFAIDDEPAALGQARLPAGLPHHDDYFGDQEIYRGELLITLPYHGNASTAPRLSVTAQGCADAGLCYPPQTRHLTPLGPTVTTTTPAAGASEQDRLATLIRTSQWWAVLGAFFGFGLLLAFTPCVLPMIPILAGIIAGDAERTTPLRGLALSLAYVAGMALTYTVAGILCAAAGQQVQAIFQKTWILVTFAGLFVALAVAMFGGYQLQMPSWLQTRLTGASQQIRGGRLVSTALMGAVSSLVVTACVAPPLVATLIVIGQVGDLARGGLALAALSFGMGSPLLLVGASAGQLLPKAGPWMETVKALFGVMFLAVAAWMMDRILPGRWMMGLWAIVAGSAWVVLARVGRRPGRRSKLRWVAASLAGLYGISLAASGLIGGSDPLHPWSGTPLAQSAEAKSLPFQSIHSIAELDQALQQARERGQRAMLDFYADWCVSCKEMEARTFSDAEIRAHLLAGYVLLKADVTANSADDQALLKRFGIFGPPTTAFFATDGHERTNARLVGFIPADGFRAHLQAFESTP